MSSLSIEEATEIARVASEAARVATEVAKAAAAQLAELEEQRIAGQLAEAEAQKQKAKDAAEALVQAELQMNAVSEALKQAKTVCDNFLKDSSGIEDKVAHALEIGKTYQDVLKQQVEANRLLSEAKKVDLPFQVPRLREELAALQAELAEVEKKEAELRKQNDEYQAQLAENTAQLAQNKMSSHDIKRVVAKKVLFDHTLINNLNMASREYCELKRKVQQKTSELHAAEVAAGLRFMFNHSPHHEMILRAAMNAGQLQTMCSCSTSMCWTPESAYPPKCRRDTLRCGKVGW